MRLQKQLYRHRPENGEFGDCDRTVIACLLDRNPEEVPHFFDGCDDEPAPQQHNVRRAWLAKNGLAPMRMIFDASLEQVLQTMGAMNPELLWILMGRSKTGCNHVVICKGGEIIHDPSLDEAGIIGPADDGYYWIEVLVPLSMTAIDAVPAGAA